MRLAAIHIRLRRRVDQRIELQCAQRRSQLFRFPKIKLSVIKPNDVEFLRVRAHQRRAQSPAPADDDNPLHAAQLRRKFQTPKNPLAREAPNPKLQVPKKSQTSNSNEEYRAETIFLMIGF